MRYLPLLLMLPLSSCGLIEREREEAAAEAKAATLFEIERQISQSVRAAERHARRANRILSPLPVMTAREEAALRRFRNADHVSRAQRIGVRADSEAQVDSLRSGGRFVRMPDSTSFWIVRRGASPAHVVPQLESLLEVVGTRFHSRLVELDLPLYRFEITSALRPTDRQRELRRTNSNAARLSAHEYGTTVDISYAAFAPPLEVPEPILNGVPREFAPHVERFTDLALESVSGRKSREIGKIFSQVLAEVQSEGLALVLYERQQTVYHVTVANADL